MQTRSSNRKEKKARTTTKPAPAGEEEGWAALLPELFDRIVDEGYLFIHELCTAVPLVCKAWNRMHKERLAGQKMWEVPQPVTAAGLQGFRMVAPGVEGLHLYNKQGPGIKKKGLLARMLATPAPNLKRLYFECGSQDTSVLASIARLTGLTKLSLDTNWKPLTPERIADLGRLTALRNLQKFHCTGISIWVPDQWSAALWDSLAALPHLRKVEVGVKSDVARWVHSIDAPDDDLGPYLRQLSKLTSIKSLKLSNVDLEANDCTNTRSTLYASISALTQLTALKLDLRLGPAKAPCLQLPQLEKLQLFFTAHCFPAKEHGCMTSTTLTRLVLHSNPDEDYPEDKRTVEELLPPTTPALANLRSLELSGSMLALSELSPAVASALPQLTSLSWNHSGMTDLSSALSAISLITTLVDLDLSENDEWVLEGEDPAPLLALPHLTKLNLGYTGCVNSLEDASTFIEKFPGVDVIHDDGSEYINM